MDLRAPGTLRMILHAAARVLGCGSAQMALVDEARQVLVIRVAVANVDAQRFSAVESLLGFPTDGLEMPLSNGASVLVRAAREGRILVTGRFSEIAGDAVPDEISRHIQSVIGTQTFAAVPVSGRSGILAVLLFSKLGDAGFAPLDRDLLVAYADRVGAALESGELDGDVEMLGSLGDLGLPQPLIFVCDASLRVVGGASDGQPLEEVLRAPDAGAGLREAAARRGDAVRIVSVHGSDGRSLRVAITPVPTRGGERACAGQHIAVVEDVAWLERLGREAARAREHLARVLGSVGGAVFTLDTVGTVVGCSGAVDELVELAPSELLGRPVIDLLADGRARRRAGDLSRRLADIGFAEGELAFLHGGRVVPAAVSALLLADDHGVPTGSLWRVQDLSARKRDTAERKRLRARLLRSERLSALGEMSAKIAHEVRNPLMSIGAAAQVVLEELGEKSRVRGEVTAIAREVRRLDTIVSGFLHAARPSAMSARRAPQHTVDLSRLVAETARMLEARGTGTPFAITSAGDCRARCDADGVRQVLWNVLMNAVEASPPGASVSCELRPRGDRIVIAISDEGQPVPPDVRRRLFDPFFSTKAKGTGLGLTISRQLLDENRGRLRLVPRRKGGMRVVIELPAAAALDGAAADRVEGQP